MKPSKSTCSLDNVYTHDTNAVKCVLIAGHAFLTLRLTHMMVIRFEHQTLLGTILTF